MGFQKNVGGQKFKVFAFDRTTNEPVTGDAANITMKIAKDAGALTATDDVNPTESENGFYLFDATQDESNADAIDLYPESTTSGVQVIGVPGTIYPDEVNAIKAAADLILEYASSYLPPIIPHVIGVGATGNDTTHVHLPFLSYGDDDLNNRLVLIYDTSEEEYHSRWIEDWDMASGLAMLSEPPLPFTPVEGDGVYLFALRRGFTEEDRTMLEMVKALVSAGPIESASATHVSKQGNELVLTRGEAYLDANNNKVSFTISDSRLPADPIGDGTTVYLRLRKRNGGDTLAVEGEISSFTAPVAVVAFEMTKAQVLALAPGKAAYLYEIDFHIEGDAEQAITSIPASPCSIRDNVG